MNKSLFTEAMKRRKVRPEAVTSLMLADARAYLRLRREQENVACLVRALFG